MIRTNDRDISDATGIVAFAAPILALALLMLMVAFHGGDLVMDGTDGHSLFVVMPRNCYLITP